MSLKGWVGMPGMHFYIPKVPLTSKNILLFFCGGGLVAYTVFTFIVFESIKRDTVAITRDFAQMVQSVVTDRNDSEIILRNLINRSENPIILTDTLWRPLMWGKVNYGPVFNRKQIPGSHLSDYQQKVLQKKVARFKDTYPPLPMRWGNNEHGFLLSGNSLLISCLVFLPFMEAVLVVLLLVLAYFSLRNIRVTERSNLWVGLAKETAHQLGTPISSLMGWVEYIRTIRDVEPPIEPQAFLEQSQKICEDMENDLIRLRKVTSRFSQIGSIPALTPCDINDNLKDVAEYFKVRLPLLRKRIEIKFDLGKIPSVSVNRDLIEWVFENLLKNSIDAIDCDDGRVEIRTEYLEKEGVVRIYQRDNGRGIAREAHKKVFTPGYSTKKRGWGLGLTLAKRIVEDYHKGRIFVNWSSKARGTEFCIDLPVWQGGNKRIGEGV
ncbi:MAG: HAMP domain-containing histidine kinase [Fibrobacter sp.]|nr:HAMP domain-containing histidine kinase [Fibrobacter sp.]